MNKFPKDDERLVDFLRQHADVVPPAAPDLEQQIMQAVASSPQPSARRRLLRVVPTAIAAGLLITWTGYRVLMPATPSAAELAKLEAFLESNWDGVLDNSAETESFPLASQTPN